MFPWTRQCFGALFAFYHKLRLSTFLAYLPSIQLLLSDRLRARLRSSYDMVTENFGFCWRRNCMVVPLGKRKVTTCVSSDMVENTPNVRGRLLTYHRVYFWRTSLWSKTPFPTIFNPIVDIELQHSIPDLYGIRNASRVAIKTKCIRNPRQQTVGQLSRMDHFSRTLNSLGNQCTTSRYAQCQ